jgi:Ni/Co efflux regulator RcnB
VARGASHSQQRQQWRSANSNWRSGTVWQRNRNWWRGNQGFRNYTGARAYFYFAPGYGYYSIPHTYWHHRWQPGEYLPVYFRRYIVRDYWDYGLPRPPYGYIWVWVDNDVLLVDRDDGYILDEIYYVW